MKNFLNGLTRANITAIIALLWTLAGIYSFVFIHNPDDQIIEKMYSIMMMIIGYYLGKNSKKEE